VQAHLPFMRSAYYIAFSLQTDTALAEQLCTRSKIKQGRTRGRHRQAQRD